MNERQKRKYFIKTLLIADLIVLLCWAQNRLLLWSAKDGNVDCYNMVLTLEKSLQNMTGDGLR